MLPLFILRVVDLQRVSVSASKEPVEKKEKGPVYPYGVAFPESLEAVMEINKDEHRAKLDRSGCVAFTFTEATPHQFSTSPHALVNNNSLRHEEPRTGVYRNRI